MGIGLLKVGRIKLKKIPRSALKKAKENEKPAQTNLRAKKKEEEEKKSKDQILKLATESKDPSIEDALDALLGTD